MEDSASFPFSPIGFVLFFVMLWCLISFLLSFIGGWFALAQRFRTQDAPHGEVLVAGPWFRTVYVRFWTHYGGIIRLVAASDALYLSVLVLFRVGHPPLRIPWSEIEVSRTKYFFRRYVELRLGRDIQIPMRISERMANKLGVFERFQHSLENSEWP